MSIAINHTQQPHVTSTSTVNRSKAHSHEGKSSPSAPSAPTPSTTVTISAAAKAAQAAQQEATETPQQTAQEARSNDRQAQKLLSKQQAAVTPPQ